MWKLEGYDAFENKDYPIEGEWPSEEKVREMARAKLREIEMFQPTDDSGGQEDEGIQDRIFVVRPDGSRYRFIPVNQ